MVMNAHQKLQKIAIKLETNPVYAKRQSGGFTAWIERFMYRHQHKLVLVHIVMFILFMILMWVPMWLPMPLHGDTFYNNFTLFSQFILWGVWFPLVFVSVIFTGRSWCGILCPMGAASEWANRIGLKRPIPAWLRWEGTPILSFLLMTILGQTVDVRNQASAILQIFGGTLILAVAIGFLFGRGSKTRAWCRHVCPIGLLLGVFSRIGMVQFAPKHKRPGGDHYSEKGVCPTNIAVSYKEESRHCIQCFRCVKPNSPGGLFIETRHPGKEIENIHNYHPNLAEILFIFMSAGISLGGFLWLVLPLYQTVRQQLADWFMNHAWYWTGNPGPSWLMSVHPEFHQVFTWIDFFMITSFMLACMLIITVILSICTFMSSLIAARCGGQYSLKSRFIKLAYQFTPVAMISIIIGLGDKLFVSAQLLGISVSTLDTLKIALLACSVLWSLYLGYRILAVEGVNVKGRLLALIPSLAGSLLIAFAWSPALLGG
jgi:hypothetical protein